MSHEQTAVWSQNLASELGRRGFWRQQRVLVMQSTCHVYPLSLTALWRLGLVAVPIYATITPGELQCIYEESEAVLVLVDRDTAGLPVLSALPEGCPILTVEELLEQAMGAKTEAHPDFEAGILEDDMAAIIYTSGSSGRPKGVLHTHASLFHAVSNWKTGLESQSYFDCALSNLTYLNLFPAASQISVTNILFTIATGGRTALLKKPAIRQIVEVVAELGVQAVQLSPQILRELSIEGAAIDRSKLGSLQCWFTGGSSFAPDEVQRFESGLPGKVYVRYGLTETLGALLMQLPTGSRSGVGQALPGCEVELVPAHDLGDDLGEVRVRTKSLAAGYLGQPEEWARTCREGWFYTGDIGRFDANSNLHIVSRRKNVIMSGTYQVWASEVETVLRKQPEIKDCAVFGLPDEILGEIVVAAIVPVPDSNLDWKSVNEWCKRQLFPQKLPRLIWFLERLPVTQAKVSTRRLKRDLELLISAGSTDGRQTGERAFEDVVTSYLGKVDDFAARSFKDFSTDAFLAAEICWRLSLQNGRKVPTSSLYNSRPLAEFMRR